MKGTSIKATLILILVMMLTSLITVSVVLAAKPSNPDHNVVELSNGYPSGPHFNLNVHGKKPDFTCPTSDPGDGYGSSIFIPEYNAPGDPAELEYVASKKFDVAQLTVLDPCSTEFDGDPARVQIPKTGIYSDGFWVFARVLAKPKNKFNEPSNLLLVPNPVLRVCNDGQNDLDGDGTLDDCPEPDSDLMPLGLVTNQGAYTFEDGELRRLDEETKGKGKVKATDITGLFTWTGYVCSDTLDIDGDGDVDEDDVTTDLDGDGVIGDADDLAMLLALNCEFHNTEWVFNVADLVVQDQDIVNDGSKLLKIRFYPVFTTEFTPPIPTVTTHVHDSVHNDLTGSTTDVGTVVHDMALVTAGTGPIPTGSATFSRFSNGDCSGTPDAVETVSLDGSGIAESGDFITVAGLLSYQAHYNGNVNYAVADGSCEPLAVGGTAIVSTVIHDQAEADVTGGTITVGTTAIHAEATVSGSGPIPTGTVDFELFSDSSCTSPVGTEASVALVSGIAESTSFLPSIGDLAYVAHYNGEDVDYFPASGPCVFLTVALAI